MKFYGLSIAAGTATWTLSAADDDARRLFDALIVGDSTNMSRDAMAADASPTTTGKSGKQGGKSVKPTMECPAGTRKMVKEKYRGKITGYQNREFYNALGTIRSNSLGLTPNPTVTIGSITSGKLYRVDAFQDEENGNPAIPDEEPIGTFIIDTAPIKDFFDADERTQYGDFTFAHSTITVCEIVELFGGCSTFIKAGDWSIPGRFGPETFDLVTYLGGAASGVGAAGYNLVERSGYIDARYNYNDKSGTFSGYGDPNGEFPAEVPIPGTPDFFPPGFMFSGQVLAGFEYQAAHGYCEPNFDGATCGQRGDFMNPCGDDCTLEFAEVTRQSRDFEVTSFALTYEEIDSFLDIAAFSPVILPVESRPGGERPFPIDTNLPPLPADEKERSTAIRKYLEDRYAGRDYQCVKA
ncbi:hypothetical protein ACHAWF_017062 [Thalassiosira exigua]